MTEKRDSGPIVLGITLLFFLLICVVMMISFTTISTSASKAGFNAGGDLKAGNIGYVEIEGAIMESKAKVEAINKFGDDEKIKGILLYINSPGGAIGPTEEIYRALMHFKDKDKKVYAVMGSLCASGGYYISSAADHVFTSEGTLTGSIGVIMQLTNFTEVYKWAKVKVNTFKSGKYKDIGNSARPMTEEEKDYIQRLVNESYQIFLNVVFKGRKAAVQKKFPGLDTDEKVLNYLKKHAQGQIILGKNAVELALADEIGDIVDAKEYIKKEIGEDVKLAKEKKKNRFEILIETLGEKAEFLSNRNETEVKLLYKMQ